MVKPEGVKKEFALLVTKYYDLNKLPIICPSCGARFDPEDYLRKEKVKFTC